jgi:hypothetical protein
MEGAKGTPKGRLVTTLVLTALAAAGGIAMGVTNSFALVMGIAGAFFAVLLLGFIPVFAWYVAKGEDLDTQKRP